MANNSGLVLGLAAAGLGYWFVVKPMLAKQTATPPAGGNPNPPPAKGPTLPANLSRSMQDAWNNAGKPTDQGNWVNAERVPLPTTDEALRAIYINWAGYYQGRGYWPNEGDLRDMVLTAIANYAGT